MSARVLHQVQQTRIGPVGVLENYDVRSHERQCPEQTSKCPCGFIAGPDRLFHTDCRQDAVGDTGSVGLIVQDIT